jgi:hypothetical protein
MSEKNRKDNKSEKQLLDGILSNDAFDPEKLLDLPGNMENIKKKKKTDGEGEGEGEGGSGEGQKLDWRKLAFGEIECPLGPDEVEKQNQEALAYTTAIGARDLAKEKNTYPADKAKSKINKGDVNTLRMHQSAGYEEQSNGPQANPNPLG